MLAGAQVNRLLSRVTLLLAVVMKRTATGEALVFVMVKPEIFALMDRLNKIVPLVFVEVMVVLAGFGSLARILTQIFELVRVTAVVLEAYDPEATIIVSKNPAFPTA